MRARLLFAASLLVAAARAGDNGLALTPPRTWRSWNAYGFRIDADTMRTAARGLVDGSRAIRGQPAGTRLLDLGYASVGMDEGWAACEPAPGFPTGGWLFHRSNADGTIAPVVNATLFPSLKGLVEELHAMGLAVGWYLNPCFSYCWKLGDSCGDECNAGDVEAALAYGFDSVKIDGCSAQHNMSLWHSLFNDSGIPILIENCHDDASAAPSKPISEGGCTEYHTYRSSTDIRNTYGSWLQNAYSVEQYATSGRTGPTCWAYPDMLMVGVGPTCAGDTCGADEPPLPTVTEQRTHFALWAILSSPLTLSMDFSNASLVDSVWPFITNTDVLAVNAAWAGSAGGQLAQSSETIVLQHCTPGWAGDKNCTVPITQSWYKPLPGGAVAVLVANNALEGNASVSVSFSSLPAGALACAQSACDVFNVLEQASAGTATGSFDVAALMPHDCAFVILSPPKQRLEGGRPAPPLPVSLGARRGCAVTLRVAGDGGGGGGGAQALVGLRNAKEVVLERWPPAAADFEVEVALEMRAAELFVYALDLGAAASASLLGTLELPACEDAAQLRAPAPAPAPASSPVVSLLFEAWQAYAANATATVVGQGGTPLSVEAVIRSNGSLVLADVWDKYGVAPLTQGFFWQEQPLLGWYCLYRKRWDEATGVLPDCANITGTVSQQTAWFAQSGVDFITADGTNLCTPSPFADAIQTRPMEVLFEEFGALRAAGFTTPAISAWQRAVTGCTLHTQILGIYNNASHGQHSLCAHVCARARARLLTTHPPHPFPHRRARSSACLPRPRDGQEGLLRPGRPRPSDRRGD